MFEYEQSYSSTNGHPPLVRPTKTVKADTFCNHQRRKYSDIQLPPVRRAPRSARIFSPPFLSPNLVMCQKELPCACMRCCCPWFLSCHCLLRRKRLSRWPCVRT